MRVLSLGLVLLLLVLLLLFGNVGISGGLVTVVWPSADDRPLGGCPSINGPPLLEF